MERRCAKDIGTQRVVCSGVRGEGDIISDKYFIECKYRKTLGVKTWYDKAKSESGDKPTILIIKQKNQHGELAVISWDWLKKFL